MGQEPGKGSFMGVQGGKSIQEEMVDILKVAEKIRKIKTEKRQLDDW